MYRHCLAQCLDNYHKNQWVQLCIVYPFVSTTKHAFCKPDISVPNASSQPRSVWHSQHISGPETVVTEWCNTTTIYGKWIISKWGPDIPQSRQPPTSRNTVNTIKYKAETLQKELGKLHQKPNIKYTPVLNRSQPLTLHNYSHPQNRHQ